MSTNGQVGEWALFLQKVTGHDWSAYPEEDARSLARKLSSIYEVVGQGAAIDQGQRAYALWQASLSTTIGNAGAEEAVLTWLRENPDLLRSAVLDAAKGLVEPPPVQHIVSIPNLPPVDVTAEHASFRKLLSLLALRHHTYLVGPAGTGKTESAQRAADALGLRWSYWAANPTATAAALLGYQDANGRYVSTPFRDMYENGGVFILDELDNSRDDLPTTLNGAMAGSFGAFPDGLVKRHPDFVVVATGNTWGKGASRIYSGRRQLDGATLNRFAKLAWEYDHDLEMKIAPVPEWTLFVQQIRNVVLESQIREVVSMRQSISGGQLLLAGWDWDDVVQVTILEGWAPDSISKVRSILEDSRWKEAARRISARK
jgi:MoxR-like ATPase